jgi:hypothetical protein
MEWNFVWFQLSVILGWDFCRVDLASGVAAAEGESLSPH